MPEDRINGEDWRFRQIAEEAAEKASEKTVALTFRGLGLDITNQDSVNAFRDDMVFVRRQRVAREALSAETRRGLVSTIVQGITAAVIGGASAIGVYLGVFKGH